MCAREHQILQSLDYSTESAFAIFSLFDENRAWNSNSDLKACLSIYRVYFAKSDFSDMLVSSERELDESITDMSIQNENVSASLSFQAFSLSNFDLENAWLTSNENFSRSLQVYMSLSDFTFFNFVKSLTTSIMKSSFQLKKFYFQKLINLTSIMLKSFTQISKLNFINSRSTTDREYQQHYYESFDTAFF